MNRQPATQAQIEYLVKLNVDREAAETLTVTEADECIRAYKNDPKISANQRKYLMALGQTLDDIENLSMSEAAKLIQSLVGPSDEQAEYLVRYGGITLYDAQRTPPKVATKLIESLKRLAVKRKVEPGDSSN